MRASGHVVGGQEHLSTAQAVHGERVGVPGNEQPLPDARGGLLGGKVAWPVGQAEQREPAAIAPEETSTTSRPATHRREHVGQCRESPSCPDRRLS